MRIADIAEMQRRHIKASVFVQQKSMEALIKLDPSKATFRRGRSRVIEGSKVQAFAGGTRPEHQEVTNPMVPLDGILSATNNFKISSPICSSNSGSRRAGGTPNDPYAWAMANRVLAGSLCAPAGAGQGHRLGYAPRVVIQKSAQVGLTELAVNLAL